MFAITLGYRISEINLKRIKEYLNIEADFTEDDDMLVMMLCASKEYIRSYTNMVEADIDNYESLTLACMMIIGDFYEVRQVNISNGINGGINKMLSSILSMNRNLG